MTPSWSAEKLTEEFHGFVAVKGVDLRVRRGTIHALIGPNGAGKTTVFNLLTRSAAAARARDTARAPPSKREYSYATYAPEA